MGLIVFDRGGWHSRCLLQDTDEWWYGAVNSVPLWLCQQSTGRASGTQRRVTLTRVRAESWIVCHWLCQGRCEDFRLDTIVVESQPR